MPGYSAITIIYNPNSTGSGKALALALEKQLRKTLKKQAVAVVPTEYKGHAERLAYELAQATSRPLIISSSGDGGYHEIVNGVMRARHAGAQAVTGLLPAGNANDHFRNLHEHDMLEAMQSGLVQTIDLLKLSYTDETGAARSRYAHSYIGLGLTPQAGEELNKHRLNPFIETWIILKVLLSLRPVRLRVKGGLRTYDSLIFSNIPRMSKVLSLSDIADARDGKFEVTAFRRHSKIRLIMRLFAASTTGLHGTRQASEFSFRTLKSSEIQLDGEILTLPPKTDATVSIEPLALRCIV
jgi:diacylglycerol kinase family enzyme